MKKKIEEGYINEWAPYMHIVNRRRILSRLGGPYPASLPGANADGVELVVVNTTCFP